MTKFYHLEEGTTPHLWTSRRLSSMDPHTLMIVIRVVEQVANLAPVLRDLQRAITSALTFPSHGIFPCARCFSDPPFRERHEKLAGCFRFISVSEYIKQAMVESYSFHYPARHWDRRIRLRMGVNIVLDGQRRNKTTSKSAFLNIKVKFW